MPLASATLIPAVPTVTSTATTAFIVTARDGHAPSGSPSNRATTPPKHATATNAKTSPAISSLHAPTWETTDVVTACRLDDGDERPVTSCSRLTVSQGMEAADSKDGRRGTSRPRARRSGIICLGLMEGYMVSRSM